MCINIGNDIMEESEQNSEEEDGSKKSSSVNKDNNIQNKKGGFNEIYNHISSNSSS